MTLMSKQKSYSAIFLLFVVLYFTQCHATPQYSVYDAQIIHTVYGTDKYYKYKKTSGVTFNLSPFYMHTGTAKNGKNIKVPAGDRLGVWQMLGIFYGEGAKPTTQLTPIRDALKTQLDTLFTNAGFPNFFDETAIPNPFDQTDPNNPANYGFYDQTFADYEKYGLRGEVCFDVRNWIGVKAKGGFVEQKNKARFVINRPVTPITALNAQVDTLLLAPEVREDLAEELNLDLSGFCHSSLEDTHAQVYCNIPFKLKDKDGDLVCTMVPHLSVGAWLTTGYKSDPNKAFSVPSGNNGYDGFTVETALNFDFPKSIQTSFGAGAVISERRTLDNYRVASSENQSGLIPWQTTITNRPGVTWYGNASFKAEDFIEGVSVFCDYIYTQHAKDSITLKECNAVRRAAFIAGDGIERLVNESCWRIQQANIGLTYRINKNLTFGFGIQSQITGTRVYRPTTSIGTISVSF